VKGTVGIQ